MSKIRPETPLSHRISKAESDRLAAEKAAARQAVEESQTGIDAAFVRKNKGWLAKLVRKIFG